MVFLAQDFFFPPTGFIMLSSVSLLHFQFFFKVIFP